MYQIPDDHRRKALETLGKTQEAANQDLQTVKTWIEQQPHFPEIMGDTEILNFLQLNKFNVARTKDKIEAYYSVRSEFPDFFTDSNPKLPQLQQAFETCYFFNHPKLHDGVSRILFAKPKHPNSFMPRELVKLLFNLFEMRLHGDCMVTDTFVLDMEHMTFRDMLKFPPSMMYKVFQIYRNVWAIRVHAVYLVHAPAYVSVWLSIFKFLLKRKIMDRVQVHRDAEVLKQVFAGEDLPGDYGGDGLSLAEYTEMTRRKLEEYQDRFDKLDVMRVKEELGPNKK